MSRMLPLLLLRRFSSCNDLSGKNAKRLFKSLQLSVFKPVLAARNTVFAHIHKKIRIPIEMAMLETDRPHQPVLAKALIDPTDILKD